MAFFAPLEMDNVAGELIRALRQGIFFGIETRIPYAITSWIRPALFGKPTRPLLASCQFFGEQTLKHGWLIARISLLFKSAQRVWVASGSGGEPKQWQTFLSGCLAGYVFMVRDAKDATLKKQINMAIVIRTLYALACYAVRQNAVPMISDTPAGYARGTAAWDTLMWGVVMWHWRHHSASGEMNKAQVASMNFIYTGGDVPGLAKWTGNRYLVWLAALIAIRFVPNSAAKAKKN